MDYPSVRSILIIALVLAGCRVPAPQVDYEVMADTIYVTRLVDRCNYQYLSADPKKAGKQLQEAERQLDNLIIEYDQILKTKGKIASQKYRQIHE